jgi:predicted phosphodiesterase
MIRFALISDVHGNRWALEAVLEDIAAAGVTDVLNLGDVFYGPLDPAGTAEILIARSYPTVRGNEDRIIVDEAAPLSETLQFVRGELSHAHTEWLLSLHPSLVVGDAYLCHGSHLSDADYLFWEIDESGARPREPGDVGASIGDLGSPLVLCGHDHVPRTMLLGNGTLVVNPGSVGLPAYSDDEPYPHVMEAGSPHARYARVSRSADGWSVSIRSVDYPWNAAADAAARNGRPDWAEWLRTGRAAAGSR